MLAGVVPALAHADNIVPNRSFEIGCSPGGTPASWSTNTGTLACSTTANTGSFGASLTTGTKAFAQSACVTLPLSGDYAASFAYNAASQA